MKNRHHSKSRAFAELLDTRFTVPGTKFKVGVDGIVGLVSGVGDWIGAVLSGYFMIYATRLGAKRAVLIRMFVNVLVDLLIGLIPVLGDLFDMSWKANIRNARMLEKLETNPQELNTESKWILWTLLFVLITLLISTLVLIAWVMNQLWESVF